MVKTKHTNISQEKFVLSAISELKARYSKKQLWKQFWPLIIKAAATSQDIKLFDKQAEIINSLYPLIILRAARGTAKSFNTAFIAYSLLWFACLFEYSMYIKFAGPRAEDSRHAWKYLRQFLDKHPLNKINSNVRLNYHNLDSHSTKKYEIEWNNDCWVKTATCDSVEMNDIRGEELDFLSIDEFGNVKYKNEFNDATVFCFRNKNLLNKMMVVGTPDILGIGEEFQKMFGLGQENHKLIKSFTLRSTDNPYFDPDTIKLAEDLLTEEGLARESLGENIPRAGRLLPNFNINTQQCEMIYNPNNDLIVGIDFGFRKPVVIFFQVEGTSIDDLRINVLHELSPHDIRISELILNIRVVLSTQFNRATPLVIGCDPAGDKENAVVSYNDFTELQKDFPQSRYTRKKALTSKKNQVYLLKLFTAKNIIYVSPNCPRFLRALTMASPDTDRSGAVNGPGWKKEKGHDDCLDAFMYGLTNYAVTAKFILPEDKEKETLTESQIQTLSRQIGW